MGITLQIYVWLLNVWDEIGRNETVAK